MLGSVYGAVFDVYQRQRRIGRYERKLRGITNTEDTVIVRRQGEKKDGIRESIRNGDTIG